MGTEAVIGGLFGLASAGVNYAAQASSASAQSSLNHQTRKFNREEAVKARNWQSQENVLSRQFNSAEAVKQRSWAAQQTAVARQFDAQQALLARQFEERMSSTAHQREVQDLYKAGLNPILSATGGSGASTPVAPIIGSPMSSGSSAAQGSTGSAAQASSPALSAFVKKGFLGEVIHSAMEGLRLENETKKAEAADKEAEAAKKNAETNALRQKAEESKIRTEIARINTDIKIAFEDLDIRKDIRDATVEEKKANVNRLISAANLSDEQASKVGLEKVELERRMRYGTFLMSYLPSDARDYIASNMIDFIKDNEPILKEFLHKAAGDIVDYEPSKDDVAAWSKRIRSWMHKAAGGKDPLNTFGNGRVRGSH